IFRGAHKIISFVNHRLPGRGEESVDWKGISEKVIVGIITAAVIGALAIFWNWASQGGLVRALGGITPKEVDDLVKKQSIPAPLTLPTGAVVAFDLPKGCPAGWVVLESAVERSIGGATTKAHSNFLWTKGYEPSIYERDPCTLGTTMNSPLPILALWYCERVTE
ncbi:MAG: hypothetical protein DLM68_02860, partial [Hyphomicrobiales bacterium]